MVRTKVLSAERVDGLWEVKLERNGQPETRRARMLINAAGPWVGDVIQQKLRINSTEGVRLVRGSHIVTKRLYAHDKCYFFQGTDGRIIFAIPYEQDFTLIGTTDAEHDSPDHAPVCTPDEQSYLIEFANRYFKQDITAADVVWTYSGVRPLYDDGASSATAATRDYTLKVDARDGAPVLNIFGGKITTYRRLAESAMDKIADHFPGLPAKWTAGVALPGGDFPHDGVPDLIAALRRDYAFLTDFWARRLVRAYGTEAAQVLGNAKSPDDLGRDFGATLTAREVAWMMTREYARRAEDVVWRRNKLGLRMDAAQIAALDAWMQSNEASLITAGK